MYAGQAADEAGVFEALDAVEAPEDQAAHVELVATGVPVEAPRQYVLAGTVT